MSDKEDVKNKTIVIVGASSGIGRGAAIELAKLGANVVVAARRSELLDELVEEIKQNQGNAIAVTADVSEREDISKLEREAIYHYNHIDVWINNVGVGALGYFWDIPLDVHERLVDVNLKGLLYGSHVALKHFIKRKKGILINVGSVDSEVPVALQNTYAATKSAVLSISSSISEELRLAGYEDCIDVATIMPWAVDTPWWTHAANYSGHAPRMTKPDDAKLVVDEIVKACTDPEVKMPVGGKAKASNLSHHLFPQMTNKMTASLAQKESHKGENVADTTGALFSPMQEGRGVDGDLRERMEKEDEQER
ncbi:SDR family NAD(P)-dependent oxidoreductase [Alteromonas pelagimontana]|uniref:SDR family NAD(P)-dependent oxidoreductase n=1 Tax=Alteromonas pelagimontana TaxID=1858656 RepID=A0A6M4MFK7_9ALTE|nr:SDR family NAD(P)-dependent oxidoreductase [Alteromonas pelagimontana]QJR81668.1 SDR family NAD(P)-dependent oxidoreductase [Alteromonas pelagimontana]